MLPRATLFLLGAAACLLAPAAKAVPIVYQVNLSGAAEAPPNASPGTGSGLITIDTDTHLISYDITFAGLLGTTTAAHIHCCTASPGTGTAGVATTTPVFPGFPLGVSSGTFNATFDMSLPASWNAAFITANGGTPAGAEAAFAAGIAAGQAYFNIHSAVFPSGEIRDFLTPVPEPATLALLTVATLASIGLRRAARHRLA